MVDDLDHARDFYGSLFGWTFEDLPPEAGGYVMARKDGHVVAGADGQEPGRPRPGQRVDGLPRDRRRRRRGGARPGGRWRLLPRADGRAPGGPHRRRRRPGRRGLRTVAGQGAHGHRPRRRARRALLGRVDEPRLRGEQGLLLRRLRLPPAGDRRGRLPVLRRDLDGEKPVGGIGAIPARRPADVPSHWMVVLRRAPTATRPPSGSRPSAARSCSRPSTPPTAGWRSSPAPGARRSPSCSCPSRPPTD